MSSITEKSYKFLTENIDISYSLNKIIYDESGEPVDLLLIDVNPAYEKLTGTNKDDVVGQLCSVKFPQLNLKLLKHFKDLKKGDHPVEISYQSMMVNRRLKVKGYIPEEGYIAFLQYDISNEIEEQLHDIADDTNFRFFAEDSSDMIIIITPQLQLSYANKVFKETIGSYEDEQHKSKILSDIIDNKSLSKIKSFIDELLFADPGVAYRDKKLDTGAEIQAQVDKLHVDLLVTPYYNNNNELLGILIKAKLLDTETHGNSKISHQLQKAVEAVILIDNEGFITDANKSAVDMIAYPASELTGKHITEFISKKSLTEDPLKLSLLKSKKGFISEREVIRKDGEIITVEISSRFYKKNSHLTFLRDITKQKTLFESLRKHDMILKALADISKNFLNTRDALSFETSLRIIGEAASVDRITIYKNENNSDGLSFNIFNYWLNESVEAPLRKTPIIKGNYFQDGFSRWHKVLSNKGKIVALSDDLLPVEKELMMKQNIRSLAMFPIFVHNEFWGFMAFGDTTRERRWSEYEQQGLETAAGIIAAAIERDIDAKALQQSQIALERILNNIDAAVFVTDMENYQVLFANNFTKELFGDIEGKTCWITLQNGFKGPCEFCTNKDLVDKNNEPRGVIKWEHKNTATGRWFQNSDIAIRWINGRMARLEIAHDITQKKEREEKLKNLVTALKISNKITEDNTKKIEKLNLELARSEKELKKLNQSKDKFFSIIAHDLRNPFQGFLGLSRDLTQNYEVLSAEDIRDLSIMLHDSANHIYKLLENLLHWSRVQRGQIRLNPEYVSIINLVELNLNLAAINARRKSITLKNRCKESDLVFTDINSINTVLRNLITNAIKFTPDNGTVEVGTLENNNERLSIYVKDNGVGMPEDKIDDLFRLDKVSSTKGTAEEDGSGLGLILCHDLIKLNCGTISIQSEENKGTTFTIELPTTPAN